MTTVAPPQAALRVVDLSVGFQTAAGMVRITEDVTFDLHHGEILAMVGESGSGKSVTAMTLLGLTRSAQTAITGTVTLGDGLELVGASERQLEGVRGKRIAYVPQDPLSALTPVYRVGDQIAEQIRVHEPVSRKVAWARAVELLGRLGIPRAADRAQAYPHEFSGGMRQRVMIAMALSCSPDIIVADEPTTALDVTIQSQILCELSDLRSETGTAVLLITHDLAVVAEVADRVAVMYGGRIVEQATVGTLFKDPLHPYTLGLLGSIPRLDHDRPRRLRAIPGAPPSFASLPTGCHFKVRCPHRAEVCDTPPALRAVTDDAGHLDRCHRSLAVRQAKGGQG